MSKKPKKVAIYARVSTDENRQNPETQLIQLREYADRRGFEIVGEYIDIASGKREDRTRYNELLRDARQRKVDVVLVWRYDRFARSLQSLVNALSEFETLGVDFISFQENVDTTTPQGKLVFQIMGSLAEFESSLISTRVKAGMKRAKKQGKHIGRAKIDRKKQKKIEELLAKGYSVRWISQEVNVALSTAQKYAKQLQSEVVSLKAS